MRKGNDDQVARLAKVHRQFDLSPLRDRQRPEQPSLELPQVVCR